MIDPIVQETGVSADLNKYTINWVSNDISFKRCNLPSGSDISNCKQLRIGLSNSVIQPNKTLTMEVTRNDEGCKKTASTVVTSYPGWYNGILHAFTDPTVKPGTGIGVDDNFDDLYYSSSAGILTRYYFDNTIAKWVVMALGKGSHSSVIVIPQSGNNIKIVYNKTPSVSTSLQVLNSSDGGTTWGQESNIFNESSYSRHIKYYGGKIYLATENYPSKVYVLDPNSQTNNIGLAPIITENMTSYVGGFMVQGGYIAYPDASNRLVVKNVNGSAASVSSSLNLPTLKWGSTIEYYNGNIYYTSSSGKLVILKRNALGVFDSFEEVQIVVSGYNANMDGPFSINKTTGTVYASTDGYFITQIYYRNGYFFNDINPLYSNSSPSNNTLMIYSNNHTYYVGKNNLMSNTFYQAPCTPSQLRMDNSEITDEAHTTLNVQGDMVQMGFSPNPVKDETTVSYVVGEAKTLKFELYNVSGHLVSTVLKAHSYAGEYSTTLNMANLHEGMYLLRCFDESGKLISQSKLVKE